MGRQARALPPSFTILETVLALGILVVVMGLVVQVGFQSLRDRSRSAARHDALELAANALEAARACSWEALTPEWAAQQSLPVDAIERLPGARLCVRVEPEGETPLTKRVTVTLAWSLAEGTPARPVELVGFFSSRAAPVTGDDP
jgi:type II secretory pathway pseudopilin PulG